MEIRNRLLSVIRPEGTAVSEYRRFSAGVSAFSIWHSGISHDRADAYSLEYQCICLREMCRAASEKTRLENRFFQWTSPLYGIACRMSGIA